MSLQSIAHLLSSAVIWWAVSSPGRVKYLAGICKLEDWHLWSGLTLGTVLLVHQYHLSMTLQRLQSSHKRVSWCYRIAFLAQEILQCCWIQSYLAKKHLRLGASFMWEVYQKKRTWKIKGKAPISSTHNALGDAQLASLSSAGYHRISSKVWVLRPTVSLSPGVWCVFLSLQSLHVPLCKSPLLEALPFSWDDRGCSTPLFSLLFSSFWNTL